ncbi:MAG: alpha/beta hydrolase [Gammaproteobacteria bacterium]|nr:alpha/beta hydrolase [Gammaproteobacteria bacterium]MYB36508.1 alpha/beta hydrolase [Gammaproteobacteria bacterium]
MPSEEMRAAVQAMRDAPSPTDGGGDIHAMRRNMEDMATLTPVPDDISERNMDAGGVPARHVSAADVRDDRGVLYFHGGGYVMGSLNTHTELMGRISGACRAPVLGIDYRLAPEHPYPAAVEDAVASYDRLRDRGIAPGQIVIAGDSAGGGLTLACLLALKEQGKPQPAGAVLLSPWTDLTASGASVRTRADADPMIDGGVLVPMAGLYCGDTPSTTPGVSPLFGDLAGLPPLLIQVGDFEVLLDDSTRLAERAREAGVDVKLEVFDGAFHVFQHNPNLPESAQALAAIGTFFDRVTA